MQPEPFTDIVIALPVALFPESEMRSFYHDVERYWDAFARGLGLPGPYRVAWTLSDKREEEVSMRINGKNARLRYEATHPPPDVFFRTLSGSLCEGLLFNRALFVTPELARFAKARANEAYKKFNLREQQIVLSTLFGRGFGLQWIEKEGVVSSDDTAESWAESCMADLEAARFCMIAHPGQIEPDEDPNDFNRLIEGAAHLIEVAFTTKGLPIPKLRTIADKNMLPDEVVFQINDLLFPAMPLLDINSQFFNFGKFLADHGHLFINRGATDYLLDALEPSNPNLLALIRALFKTDLVTGILRRLAAEGFSIRPLVRILEIMMGGREFFRQPPGKIVAPPLSESVFFLPEGAASSGQDVLLWAELVRMNLKNAVINRALPHFDTPFTMNCFSLETAFLERLYRAEGLPEDERTALLQHLHRQIAQNRETETGKIRPVLTLAAYRPFVREWIAREFPDTPVFSTQECLPRVVAYSAVQLTDDDAAS
jgi:hypothetical protein